MDVTCMRHVRLTVVVSCWLRTAQTGNVAFCSRLFLEDPPSTDDEGGGHTDTLLMETDM